MGVTALSALRRALPPRVLRAGRWALRIPVAVRARRHARHEARLIAHPRLFNEKVYSKMAHDRRPMLTTYADKVAVRDFVAERVGSDILTTAYAIGTAANDIDWAALPDGYVAKVAHGSGGIVIVSPAAEIHEQLPTDIEAARWGRFAVRRAAATVDRLVPLFDDWLGRDYSTVNGDSIPEWCYEHVPRRILVEELLTGPDGLSPPDYKFSVIHGVCRWIQVDLDRGTHHRRDLMSPQWQLLPATFVYQSGAAALGRPSPRPLALDRMISIAEALGRDTDFVRVDLYAIGERVVFGELTNYPEAGRQRFTPRSFDRAMGRLWSPPHYESL